jgi:uncharacterized protein YdeI (YjbR/CyaY-like superfamily)
MAEMDDRIDAYISKAEEFARPVLNHLSAVVYEACPDVQETIKWDCPHFEYGGNILCSMAAFKNHCAFGFWLSSMMKDPYKLLESSAEKTGMGHFGQLKTLGDLPIKKILKEYIRHAMELIDQRVKRAKPDAASRLKTLEIPDYFKQVLAKNKKAQEAFERFSFSHKKEYIEWIVEAKTEATRNKRMMTAVGWLTTGKSRNWKYTKP